MGRRKLISLHSIMVLVGCLPPAGLNPPPSSAEPAPAASAVPPPAPEELPTTDAQLPESVTIEPKRTEPGITRTSAPTRGTLPKAVVQEKLDSAGPSIRACYEHSLKTKPALAGNLSIDFVVATDGTVEHAQAGEVEQPLNDPATVECILGEIRKLEFPKPNGGRVFLNYPLHLEPAKPEP